MSSFFYTPDEINKFNTTINNLIAEIQTTKKETDPSLWKPEYDNLYEKLLDITDIAAGNIITAHEMYQELPISKYDSFTNYIYNTDINMITLKKGNNERTKMLRATRKDKVCPECNHPLTIANGGYSCPACGYTSDVKGSTPIARSSSDSSKHTYKQLDAIVGIKKAPANISKILKYISIWLTDLKFIYAWLVSNKKLEQWMKKYTQITNDHITLAFFNRVIEAKPENMWDCETYKLFADELYNLLENAKRYSKIKSSNMEALGRDAILDVFKNYIRVKGTKLPSTTETFSSYEIGAYVSKLSLIYEVPDDDIKNDIEKLFGKSLTMPGLMFNFNDVYEQSDNVPKKYAFGQEYIHIIHATFNVPFINIPPQDKDAIVQIILQFNNYYKAESYKKNGKDSNAPLFCCTLACVLTQLPYFVKYRDALRFVPTKDKTTSLRIKAAWFRFTSSHPEEIKKYSMPNITVDTGANEESVTDMIKDDDDLPEEIHMDDDMVF